jgi:predicted RNA-binding protein with RPS1 domain
MKNEVFEAICVAVNRGGAMFLVEGLRAFLPGSHLQGYTIDDELVGETLPLKFLEVNQRENRLVVSHRRAVIEKEMDSVKRGDIIEGTVKVLKSYGAFIQVGRISGLLHISQISSGLISNLEDVIQPGQTVKCMIIEVDKMNSRIALSTKALEPEPGMMLKDPEKVFNNAEEMGTLYLERMKTKNKQRDIIQTNKSQVEKNELKVNYSQNEEELLFGENILLNNSDILENVISGYNDNFIQNKTSDPSFKEKLQRDT